MTIQDLGSIGELIAAIATIATLAYLGAQVRQNTRALRSSTFQGISEQMAQNVEPIVANAEVSALIIKGLDGLSSLSPEERLRFQSVLVMSFRRMESVHVQTQLGMISEDLTRGFETSILSLLHSQGGREWWATASLTFNHAFSSHVDEWLSENEPESAHPSLGFPL